MIKAWSAQTGFSIPHELLPEEWQVSLDEQALTVSFSGHQPMLSSAVMNGGFQQAHGWINLRVPPKCIVGVASLESVFQPHLPDVNKCYAGMMTAASMKSCRIASNTIIDSSGIEAKLSVLLTSGIGNLRCAGDTAEYRELQAVPKKVGTINILLGCSRPLTPAAMAEAIMMATEAKVAALIDLQLLSPVSGNMATGTGTDAIAITSPAVSNNEPAIEFVGKHTIIGETLARLVIDALKDSINKNSTDAKASAK